MEQLRREVADNGIQIQLSGCSASLIGDCLAGKREGAGGRLVRAYKEEGCAWPFRDTKEEREKERNNTDRQLEAERGQRGVTGELNFVKNGQKNVKLKRKFDRHCAIIRNEKEDSRADPVGRTKTVTNVYKLSAPAAPSGKYIIGHYAHFCSSSILGCHERFQRAARCAQSTFYGAKEKRKIRKCVGR